MITTHYPIVIQNLIGQILSFCEFFFFLFKLSLLNNIAQNKNINLM
jgi:hypothetical protein